MTHRPTRSAQRRLAGVTFAALLAVLIGATPQAARPALAAADPLRTVADAVYTLDPDAGRVHVSITVKTTDLKPNSAQFIYYYRELGFGVQPEATSIKVTDRSGSLSTTIKKRKGFTEVDVHLRSLLYYRDSVSFTIRYDLVGGAPRSDSPTRVGLAFASFGVWAWGDVGHSTVQVRTPAGFDTTFDGDRLTPTTTTTGTVLNAEPDDPATFYAVVSAENKVAYDETRISFDGGVELVVRAWPEDTSWATTVVDTLRDAIPELRMLIGLDWPVAHDLRIRERFTPALEGYAGVFFNDDQRIDLSEDLDPVTIVHESSHAWFNDDLFVYRWIYEGLAQEYAYQALHAIGAHDDGGLPTLPDARDPGFADLGKWTFPEVIRDQQTDDNERYGYQASFWVIHVIVGAAGNDVMRAAYRDADANLTAYRGVGTPETVLSADGWMRLLDLTEPLGQPDSATVDGALRAYVLSASDELLLDDRAGAREAYRALLGTGAGWLPPWYVRKPMGEWGFAPATTRMAEATAVLGLRDQVATAAAALGLAPDGALKTAYEGAQDGFEGATAIAGQQLAALVALASAKAAVEAAPDLVAQVGLLGETPVAAYQAAAAAFEAGQLDAAATGAAAASATIGNAPAIGQTRLLIAGGSVAGLLLLLLVVALLVRRRLTGADPSTATLASDPGEASPPSSASPPDDEGGPASA